MSVHLPDLAQRTHPDTPSQSASAEHLGPGTPREHFPFGFGGVGSGDGAGVGPAGVGEGEGAGAGVGVAGVGDGAGPGDDPPQFLPKSETADIFHFPSLPAQTESKIWAFSSSSENTGYLAFMVVASESNVGLVVAVLAACSAATGSADMVQICPKKSSTS